ncbi:MAG TPA: TspO/MBR family protein [Steroidobacteraceae bacterium]|nr:TspO/MBR family protein [Steroidobacteraceae bacterium]
MQDTSAPLRTIPSRVNPWLALIGWLLLTTAAGAIGAIASIDAAQFYSALNRPPWAPPPGVFGPVWTLLYMAMGVAAWLVWRERGFARARGALGLFLAQLAVNALWSWLFFAWHRGAAAFVDIVVLLALIVATIVSFAKIRRAAALLLVPYLAWVAFATALNYSVWQRNLPLL